MKIAMACVIVLLGICGSAAADDQGNYGPDWPVCRNIAGEPNGVIDACRRLIDANVLTKQHLSWAYNNTATAWRRLNRPDLAFANFRKAIDADPTNHAPYFNVAQILASAGHFTEALQFHDKAIALKPDMPDAYCIRGQLLEKLQRMDEALTSYEKELARDPNHDCAIYSYVKIAEDRHEEDKAIAVLDRALQADPNNAEDYHRRAGIYFDLGQYDRALADVENAVRLDPHDKNALLLRGETYREVGRLDDAISDDNAALALKPDDPVAYIERARVELLKGDYASAAADCERRASLFPGDRACADLGWHIAMLAGKFEAAAGNAATLADAHVPSGLLYRGVAEFGAGKTAEAAPDFEQYVAAMPEDPYGWLWLYLADRSLGKDDAARIKPIAAKRDAWPNVVLRHIVGAATADEVLAAADVPDPQVKQQRLAEANYYLGALAVLDGHADAAAPLFQASVAAGRVALDSRKAQQVYKADNDLERSLAEAALHGKGL